MRAEADRVRYSGKWGVLDRHRARDFVAWLSGTKPNSVLSSERLTVVDIVAVGASRRLSMDE
jgi:hypothetical protein